MLWKVNESIQSYFIQGAREHLASDNISSPHISASGLETFSHVSMGPEMGPDVLWTFSPSGSRSVEVSVLVVYSMQMVGNSFLYQVSGVLLPYLCYVVEYEQILLVGA